MKNNTNGALRVTAGRRAGGEKATPSPFAFGNRRSSGQLPRDNSVDLLPSYCCRDVQPSAATLSSRDTRKVETVGSLVHGLTAYSLLSILYTLCSDPKRQTD